MSSPGATRKSSQDPETEKKRRLKETDIDPSGDVSTEYGGQTEEVGNASRVDNQPAENREAPTRSENRETTGHDSENPPQPGHEE